MKRILLLLAGMLCAGTVSSRTEQTTIKIMSYNIRGTGHSDDVGDLAWDVRKGASIAMIGDQRPDVIGFQEPKTEQVAYLIEQLPEYAYVEAGRDQGVSTEGEHLLVMWLREKYDMIDWGYYWLSETPDRVSRGWDAKNRRISVWVCLKEKATSRQFYYFNTHQDHKGREARRQGAMLNVRMMRKIAGKRATVFISGDMNSERGGKTGIYTAPYEAWMTSAQAVAPQTDDRPSCNGFGRNRARTLDYIFFRGAVKAQAYQTIDTPKYGFKYISDHFPVMATFQFE